MTDTQDDTLTRLNTTSTTCIEMYKNWTEDQKNNTAKGDLNSAIHELRKVLSRLEIEIAVSERDNNPRRQKNYSHNDDDNDNGPDVVKKTRTRRSPSRKEAS